MYRLKLRIRFVLSGKITSPESVVSGSLRRYRGAHPLAGLRLLSLDATLGMVLQKGPLKRYRSERARPPAPRKGVSAGMRRPGPVLPSGDGARLRSPEVLPGKN
jgi:hypothetical protein